MTLTCIDSIVETNAMLISRTEWVKEKAEYKNRDFFLALFRSLKREWKQTTIPSNATNKISFLFATTELV